MGVGSPTSITLGTVLSIGIWYLGRMPPSNISFYLWPGSTLQKWVGSVKEQKSSCQAIETVRFLLLSRPKTPLPIAQFGAQISQVLLASQDEPLAGLPKVEVLQVRRWAKNPDLAGFWHRVRGLSTDPGLAHLVDADQSIDHIKRAMQVFHGQQQVTVFAPPLRSQNKEWCSFLETTCVRFQPVNRLGTLDPTDEAIKATALEVAHDQGTRCVALLTNDSGYVELVRNVRSAGKECVLIMQEHLSYSLRGLYQALKWAPLERVREFRVQAILEADGSGRVSLEQHLDHDALTDQVIAEARSFLQEVCR